MSSFRNPSPEGGLFSIERVVALLTPVFAAAAGWVSTEVATLVGVQIPRGDFTAIFISGATAAVGAALAWLHGRQKFTQVATDAERLAKSVADELRTALPGFAIQDIESVVATHASQIIDALGKSLHAPASAEEIAKQIVRELWPSTAPQALRSGQAVAGGGPVQ